MSWTLTRFVKDSGRNWKTAQTYCDADIYGRNGKWMRSDEHRSPWPELPYQFRYHDEAEKHLKDEQKKDPDWDYSIEYYE